VDSITTPWTLRDIARDFGLTGHEVILIARRQRWRDPAYEPDGEWWKEREARERREERERRRREREAAG
jgi:hypothetical protein